MLSAAVCPFTLQSNKCNDNITAHWVQLSEPLLRLTFCVRKMFCFMSLTTALNFMWTKLWSWCLTSVETNGPANVLLPLVKISLAYWKKESWGTTLSCPGTLCKDPLCPLKTHTAFQSLYKCQSRQRYVRSFSDQQIYLSLRWNNIKEVEEEEWKMIEC